MEIWDAYYRDGTKAGIDLVRDEVIPDELYHLVCEIIVKHIDDTYLLMQRDFQKKGWPGMYEASAGGSALKGETPIQGALRELQEETGVVASELTQLYRTVSEWQHSIYYGYLCLTDCKKDSITLQKGETIAYKWVNAKELLEIINSEEYVDTYRERQKKFLQTIRE
jgi:8-oxo-dGTP diphosphatase